MNQILENTKNLNLSCKLLNSNEIKQKDLLVKIDKQTGVADMNQKMFQFGTKKEITLMNVVNSYNYKELGILE